MITNEKNWNINFHRAINYGACLQAYALKKYIKDQGNECDIIDYHCPAIEDFYNRVFCGKIASRLR